MTIGYKDICPNCKSNLTQATNDIDEEHIFDPFQCPFCGATLAFKKYYSWLALGVGISWVVFTLSMYGIRILFEHLTTLETVLEILSVLSIVLFVFILWLQHIKVIKRET
jgi:amino acid transporter